MKREDLEADRWVLGGDMVFRKGSYEALPLYEGQLINRYDHRARTYAGHDPAKKYGRKPGIPYTSDEAKSDPGYEIEPRYWMMREQAEARITQRIGDRLMIGVRDVSRPSTDSRTAKAALLPRWPASDSLSVIGVGVKPLEFLALYNSTTFDFLVRGKMPGSHSARTWLLSQIACPLPTSDTTLEEMASGLSATSNVIAGILGRDPQQWDPQERYRVDTELDARIAHVYGLSEAEYAVVLDSFDVLARKEIKRYKRYRFKKHCLKAFRRLR